MHLFILFQFLKEFKTLFLSFIMKTNENKLLK